MELRSLQFTADSLLTSHQAGTLLQVNPSSINKWVKEGRIPAFRTPGGHRRIRAGDLVAFLSQHDMPIPKDLEGASRRRMLIVDDDKAYLRSLERAMEGQSIELVTCNNAVEALVKVGSFKPHLIVLDILMPGMDGFQTAERLRDSPETADIELVLVSGALTDEMRERAKRAGITATLSKPVNIEELIQLSGGLLTKASA